MTRERWYALLCKFPQFNLAWPDAVKAKWFETFRDLLVIARAGEVKS